jgi:hypothetical protein
MVIYFTGAAAYTFQGRMPILQPWLHILKVCSFDRFKAQPRCNFCSNVVNRGSSKMISHRAVISNSVTFKIFILPLFIFYMYLSESVPAAQVIYAYQGLINAGCSWSGIKCEPEMLCKSFIQGAQFIAPSVLISTCRGMCEH